MPNLTTTTPPSARVRVGRVSFRRGDNVALIVGLLLTLYSLVVILSSARASYLRDQAVRPAEVAAPATAPALPPPMR